MQLTHTVEIEATPAVVWAAHEDIERWPERLESMERVQRLDEGELGVGSRAKIKQPWLPALRYELTELEPERRVTWENHGLGLHIVATHALVATATGGTELTLSLEMSGLPARLGWPLMRGLARKFQRQEAAGFKAYCEAR
ncbi:MAG: polyketide cyclase [Dehalococcoidia bacterium]|jgi:carbon monoxide dehydrogenase subunit G|nr:polyketide cyclase [Dehalococcoidia bacterium]